MIDVEGIALAPGCRGYYTRGRVAQVKGGTEIIRKDYPDVFVSVDILQSKCGTPSIEEGGADIINDVSGGIIDPDMLSTGKTSGALYLDAYEGDTEDYAKLR